VSLDVNGGLATRIATLTLSSSSSNDNITLPNSSFVKVSGPTGAFTITGFAAGANGQRCRLLNRTGYKMTVTDQATSSSGNQIITGAGATVSFTGSSQILDMIYNNKNGGHWLLGSINTPTQGAIGSILYVTKTSDEGDSLGVLQDDDELTMTSIPANQTWEVNGEVELTNTSNSQDSKVNFSLPSGATIRMFYTGVGPTGGGAVQGCNVLKSGTDSSEISISNSASTLVSFRGILAMSSTTGNLKFRWASRVANAAAKTYVKAGSYFRITRVL
jgi:hypothetical protein